MLFLEQKRFSCAHSLPRPTGEEMRVVAKKYPGREQLKKKLKQSEHNRRN
uniref:Uncharacterized protein n=1 Tax=Arion vulgaris TaxID=1028688 RepID=A0A0B6ZIA7_9EUPU